MSPEDRKRLAKVLIGTAFYYDRQLDEVVVGMMLDDLNDLPAEPTIRAYSEYRRNPRNRSFPLPAQIRELVDPVIDTFALAKETAARIVGALTKFGYNNYQDAEAYIGPVGWDAVRRQGGWTHLCENVGVTIQPTTLQAQLRDQLELHYRLPSHQIDRAVLFGGHKSSGGLVPIGKIMFGALEGSKRDED